MKMVWYFVTETKFKDYCSKLDKKNEDLVSWNIHWQRTTEPPPLLEELKEAINDLRLEKSPGNDEVTAEMITNWGGGENVEMFYH